MGRDQQFNVVVEEVHSGDDLILMVDLGIDGLFKRVRARLKGVDTPSAFKAKSNTEAGAVRDKLKGVLASGNCSVIVHSQGKGGWVVTLFVTSTEYAGRLNVNDMMVQQGYVYQTKSRVSHE